MAKVIVEEMFVLAAAHAGAPVRKFLNRMQMMA